ncbi:MAG TPA: WYL domain-containing protein [Acidimicrobiales bacterium]|nr:WYL domain-containing protein [Acidimicrobiales bacterium]
MTRLERLHAITEEIRLRAPRAVSAAWLAEELGVTRRTIERDLATLRAAGLPLLAEPGRRGGQRLHPSALLPPLNLTDREATALLVALTIADGMPYTSAARTAAAKLRRGLPDGTATATADLCERIRIEQPLPSQVDRRILAVLEDAVASATVVRIDYRDRHGRATRRDVEGAGFLGASDGWWYLGAWCRLRQDRRLFRLDRIERATLTKERAATRDLDEVLGWLPAPTTAPR